ncbi:MAG: hypothetical protein RBT76_15050 [candidate division Zixibacteria bacterium]|nr:hypothetical protein [candidate division Zixibacteria bacterium]
MLDVHPIETIRWSAKYYPYGELYAEYVSTGWPTLWVGILGSSYNWYEGSRDVPIAMDDFVTPARWKK